MKNMIIDGITYLEKRDFNAEEIKDLFESVSWMSAKYSNRLVKAFKKAGTVIVAMDEEKLVGLIEVVDDGELNAYIHFLLIRPEYQANGVGSNLLKIVKDIYKDYLYLVVACENVGTVPFYIKNQFEVAEHATFMEIVNEKTQDLI